MMMEGDGNKIAEISEKISDVKIQNETDNSKTNAPINYEYRLPLLDVYKLALNFYKEKGGKAVHFSYEDNLQLVAFSQQVVHGPIAEAIHKIPPLGTLDVVGKDRREAWQKLGQLSADQARTGFVELLSRRCPLFTAYVEAHRREKDEQEKRTKEAETKRLADEELKRKQAEEDKILQEQAQKQEAIKRQIQQALNEQTYGQFRKFAELQYPGDPEKQGSLIRQLQEQHYIQYILQLQSPQNSVVGNANGEFNDPDSNIEATNETNTSLGNHESEDDDTQWISAPSMWTVSAIDSFKQRVSQSEGDGVVRVGHGETVTVRVPTHPQGSRLFWEFATDHYDIGFGIYFEFGTPLTEEVSVHVAESDDEDADLDDDEEEEEISSDIESGAVAIKGMPKPLLTEIVPVFRRDCQTEVYAGSHKYPGKGVYLLKFDNSYSLWRSKTLYYRVYYTH